MVFAVREPATRSSRACPELRGRGLGDDDARALLASASPVRLDERVRDRIVAETRGNPLALLELPRGLTPRELAGGFGLPGAQRCRAGSRSASAAARGSARRRRGGCCCVAAAEPLGDPPLLWRAAERLGIVAAAVDAGRTPGCSSSARGCASAIRSCARRCTGRRRPTSAARCTAALAEATDRERRSRTAAPGTAPHAAAGPDEDVAAELERSAGRAQARGGLAAAAAFLQRAVALTADPARRARRARSPRRRRACRPARSTPRCGAARHGRGRPARRAPARPRRPAPRQIAFAAEPRQRGAAATARGGAAARAAGPALARETYLDALERRAVRRRLRPAPDCRGRRVRRGPRPPAADPARATCCWTASRCCSPTAVPRPRRPRRARGRVRAEPTTRPRRCSAGAGSRPALAVDAVGPRRAGLARRDARRWSSRATPARSPCSRSRSTSRRSLRAAAASSPRRRCSIAEADARRRGDGHAASRRYGALLLAAWRGREAEATALIERDDRGAQPPGRGPRVAIRALGARGAAQRPRPIRGRARGGAGTASDARRELFVSAWAPSELIEAATRTGDTELAPRRARAAGRAHAAPRHGLGARHRGALARPAERGRERRAPATARRSSGSAARGCARSSPARTCSTASGCAARTGASTRASSCAPPTSMFAAIGHGGVRRARPARAAGHGREGAQAQRRDARRADRRRRRRSRGSRATGSRTRRSARGSSSARARSSGTCARCSPSSASAPAGSSRRALPDSESQPTAA